MLSELQTVAVTVAAAAATAFIAWLFNALRAYLGIKESDANEEAIRRAALTEAGKLVTEGRIDDPVALLDAARKVIADLQPQVQAESYNPTDVKDMIIGAAATVFPALKLLQLLK
ncbi:MAG TPA: hypothetical protein VFW22_07820 [Pseudolabrys sp.]|nr:hypothetical protein [Pseudolabrys sp.]